MKVAVIACALGAAMVFSGCAAPVQTYGTQFKHQAVATLVPGKTTKDEVVAAIGPLGKVTISTAKKDAAAKELANPIILEKTSYSFGERTSVPGQQPVLAHRTLSLAFNDATLIWYRYTSSFAGESTNFDESKVSTVKKGMSEAEVIALMGTPSGRAVHPYAREVDGSSISYLHTALGSASRKIKIKSLTVYLDGQRKVSDFDLSVREE